MPSGLRYPKIFDANLQGEKDTEDVTMSQENNAAWTFNFIERPSLPPLAWCARISKDKSEIQVWHGTWVETWEDGFSEGAWDSPFHARGFDEAVSFSGTGARVRDGQLLFVAATNMRDRLYTCLSGKEGDRFISNSMIFVLVMADDSLHPSFGYYSGEIMMQAIRGIHRHQRHLPTSRGRLELHECINLGVDRSLRIARHKKALPRPPRNYRAYIEMLRSSIGRTIRNAGDSARKHCFEPVVTLSRGYDSPMVAALACAEGCNEALTFSDLAPFTNEKVNDNGAGIAEALGMDFYEFRRNDYRSAARGDSDRNEFPEAEFCACPPAIDYPMASMEAHLRGRVLLTGAFGDSILDMDKKSLSEDFRQSSVAGMVGGTMTEFRLRLGFINFPPLYIGAQHCTAIHEISSSEEMRPWSVGGDYDRPIARRALNEAGIADDMFATNKAGTAWGLFFKAEDLTAESFDDFQRFMSSRQHIPRNFKPRLTWFIAKVLYKLGVRGDHGVSGIPSALKVFTRSPLEDHLFRWGFNKLIQRYHIDDVSK